MCTVTVIANADNFIITSNRDEKTARLPASLPSKLITKHKEVYYAKDLQANGTWFAADNKGDVVVLLNGAFDKHDVHTGYAKSRGVVLLELFADSVFPDNIDKYDLTNIEPFQLIIKHKQSIRRFVWDGSHKYFFILDKNQHCIFSSVTLYDQQVRRQRQLLFDSFILSNETITKDKILSFHKQSNDSENGLVINRNNIVKTLSISQVVINNQITVYDYHDLQQNITYTHIIPHC